MNTPPPRDREPEVLAAMANCPDCRNLSADAREAHKTATLADLNRKRSIPLHKLPDHVWPNGKRPAAPSFNRQGKHS